MSKNGITGEINFRDSQFKLFCYHHFPAHTRFIYFAVYLYNYTYYINLILGGQEHLW